MLVLASRSPRRQEILRNAGIDFLVRPVVIDESVLDGEAPQQHVRRLAGAKALQAGWQPGEIVLGADTVVVVDEHILGKPGSPADAAAMLRRLSGREHQVLTGICLRAGSSLVVEAESTTVRFLPLTDDDIAAYVSSAEPYDKAGAYAIQGLASKYIDRIEGCYFNVVGLPVSLVSRLLRRF
jgi:septum formation protein